MSERVRTYIFLQSDVFCQFLDDVEYHDARDVFSAFADKNKVFIAWFDCHVVSVDEIGLEFLYASPGYGNKALLVAFPVYLDKSLFQI